MRRLLVATAGHVDHGKSALVRALTGVEPDRWEEERRRGLTIDLGFAATRLPSGRDVAFVDVPGHERFLDNALAGLAAAPAVCFVVAADQGWQRQSDDHRDAIAALGIGTGVLVISRCDLAPDAVDEVRRRVRAEFAPTGLAEAPIVAVSSTTGDGLDELRARLDGLQVSSGAAGEDRPDGDDDAPVRLWIDRAFSISGAGTVVTGSLGAGRIAGGDRLRLVGRQADRQVDVRGIRRHDEDVAEVGAWSRVALNLRGLAAEDLGRGDVLLAPERWHLTETVDVRRASGLPVDQVGEHLSMFVGTAAVPVRVRALDGDHARLRLSRRLPLRLDDAAVLVDPGGGGVRAGVRVMDVDPPELTRRGAASARARTLRGRPPGGDLAAEVRRRGAVSVDALVRFGVVGSRTADPGAESVRRIADLFVDADAVQAWATTLRRKVVEAESGEPLTDGITRGAALDLLGLPECARREPAVLDAVVVAAEVQEHAGRLRTALRRDLGDAEAAMQMLERRLRQDPFRAPEADELRGLGLGRRELAAAEARGRVLRLPGEVVLLPDAPARAMRVLSSLEPEFTAGRAREALGTTRRVAIPLLEHLDGRGWTRRIDAGRRTVVR
ncbi:MAG: SelB C-terminal domain-containing protein [Nesterenkonia sp.]|uniref:selenocysteine-specific translation elongation factor n=1 Tax=Nesterenkonia marinintestina TaxID=2979865 RepID=UPI0021BF50B6|nr:selenocysteine-specific translation elongation factor [Nesterenkonia sp. GX14115]MDO5492234.1 SelB C-terminal domain-containing protein [Nesterenkonia sp.]